MRCVGFHRGWYLPQSARRAIPVAVVIIIVVVAGSFAVGYGRIALTVLAMSLLTTAVGEMLRATLRWRRRIA